MSAETSCATVRSVAFDCVRATAARATDLEWLVRSDSMQTIHWRASSCRTESRCWSSSLSTHNRKCWKWTSSETNRLVSRNVPDDVRCPERKIRSTCSRRRRTQPQRPTKRSDFEWYDAFAYELKCKQSQRTTRLTVSNCILSNCLGWTKDKRYCECWRPKCKSCVVKTEPEMNDVGDNERAPFIPKFFFLFNRRDWLSTTKINQQRK